MKKLLCAAMFLAACSDPVASGPVRIEPDQQTYTVFGSDEAVSVGYTIVNDGAASITVETCGNPAVDQLVGMKWVTTPTNFLCVILPPVVIAPGATYRGTVGVVGPGTWRIHLAYDGEGAAAKSTVSHAFQSRIPPD